MWLEWIAFLLCAGLAAGLAIGFSRAPGRRATALVAAVVGLLALATAAAGAVYARRTRAERATQEAFAARVPREGRPGGYVSSSACQACHPSEHASWRRSFHRTMTQVASPATALAPFEGVPPLRAQNGQLELDRRGEELWVRFRPSAASATPRDFRVGLLTGSHHMQIYWVNGAIDSGNRLEMFPYAYLIADRRWVPARDTFLADPTTEWSFDVWNTQCLQCHATAGQPRAAHDSQNMDSQVGELGIACESCHGPGEAHVLRMQSPLRRYAAHLGVGAGADTLGNAFAILNPARLPARAASEVCGQCHGYFAITDPKTFLREGFSYRPGQSLEASKPTLHPEVPAAAPYLAALRASDPHFEDSLFWSDGAVRVTGREWTDLRRSSCHQRGDLGCLSCHSMHASDPDDQLAAGREGNGACLGCHREQGGAALAAHTHHAPTSPGSVCYNCHMPYTTYGLLKAVRSHTVDSPRVATSVQTGRPNACNQCHLDRSQGWTAALLRDWYGQSPPALDQEAQGTAAGVLWAVKGDAGQRALMAWSMGWGPARAASGSAWMTPYLLLALNDPYSAVRYIAQRSLRQVPGFEAVDYDYVAPPERIDRQVAALLARWAPLRQPEPDPDRAARLLLRPDGSLATARVDELLSRRDQRSLELRE